MKKRVILVVDDEPININIIANILKNMYHIKVATNGEDALTLLQIEEVDLILLDVIMPVMDGYTLAKKIRNNTKLAHIPYIFITAMNDPISIQKGFKYGAVDYISKPFFKEELLARVATHIKVNSLQNSLTQTIKDLEQQMIEVNHSQKEFETIFNYSKEGIAITDLESNFLKFNEAYKELTQCSHEELLQTSYLAITAPEDLERSKTMIETVISKGSLKNFEETFIVKNAQRVRVNCSISLLPDEKRLLIVAKDVTSIKSLEEQAKLASMGEMISNIAHQWRQPLSIISTVASGSKIQKELGTLKESEFASNMDTIVKESQYLSNTIDDFKDFIKGNKNFSDCSVKKMIEESLQLMNAALKNSFVTVVLDIKEDGTVFAVKGQMIQALINIINNAKDALEKQKNSANHHLFVSTYKTDEKKLKLEIYDNGNGINSEVMDRIFEPYFTTKHQSVGTGIGLSMTRKIIVENHSFGLSVYNKEFTFEQRACKGACFVIEFDTK